MTASEDTPTPDLDRRRRRRIVQIAGGGFATGVGLALGAGLAGAEGRAGAAVMLLVTATGCGVAALYGVATAIIDDLRDRRVSARRIVWTVALFFAAAALMAMVAGIGG